MVGVSLHQLRKMVYKSAARASVLHELRVTVLKPACNHDESKCRHYNLTTAAANRSMSRISTVHWGPDMCDEDTKPARAKKRSDIGITSVVSKGSLQYDSLVQFREPAHDRLK